MWLLPMEKPFVILLVDSLGNERSVPAACFTQLCGFYVPVPVLMVRGCLQTHSL